MCSKYTVCWRTPFLGMNNDLGYLVTADACTISNLTKKLLLNGFHLHCFTAYFTVHTVRTLCTLCFYKWCFASVFDFLSLIQVGVTLFSGVSGLLSPAFRQFSLFHACLKPPRRAFCFLVARWKCLSEACSSGGASGKVKTMKRRKVCWEVINADQQMEAHTTCWSQIWSVFFYYFCLPKYPWALSDSWRKTSTDRLLLCTFALAKRRYILSILPQVGSICPGPTVY